jgi:hypothetical protein
MSRMVPSDMINLQFTCVVEACINAQCTIWFRELRSRTDTGGGSGLSSQANVSQIARASVNQ